MKTNFKFEIGQTVIVIDSENQYSIWTAKAEQMGLTNWKGGNLRNGQIAKITVQDIHNDGKTRIYGITCEDGSQHIIGEAGLEAFAPQTSPTITISRTLLGEYYDAATTDQRKYLVDNFKLNGDTTVEAIVGLHDIACDKWKAIIKKNHPECFPEESKYFDLSHLLKEVSNRIFTDEEAIACGFTNSDFLQVRGVGEYKEKGFYLSDEYNWSIVKDSDNTLVLVPTKKK